MIAFLLSAIVVLILICMIGIEGLVLLASGGLIIVVVGAALLYFFSQSWTDIIGGMIIFIIAGFLWEWGKRNPVNKDTPL